MGLWHVVTTWRISKYRSPPPKVIDGFYMFLRLGPWLLLVNPVQNDPNIAGGHQNGGLVGHPLLPFYLHQVPNPMNSHCTLLPWKIHPKKPQKPYNNSNLPPTSPIFHIPTVPRRGQAGGSLPRALPRTGGTPGHEGGRTLDPKMLRLRHAMNDGLLTFFFAKKRLVIFHHSFIYIYNHS